jgi:ammonium transporter, Amt family
MNQLLNQVIGILAAGARGVGLTFVILNILDATMGLRLTDEEEVEGLDLSQHFQCVA